MRRIRCDSHEREPRTEYRYACCEIGARKQIRQALGCHGQDRLDFSSSWNLQKERTGDREKLGLKESFTKGPSIRYANAQLLRQ